MLATVGGEASLILTNICEYQYKLLHDGEQRADMTFENTVHSDVKWILLLAHTAGGKQKEKKHMAIGFCILEYLNKSFYGANTVICVKTLSIFIKPCQLSSEPG